MSHEMMRDGRCLEGIFESAAVLQVFVGNLVLIIILDRARSAEGCRIAATDRDRVIGPTDPVNRAWSTSRSERNG